MNLATLKNLFISHKELTLFGRYIFSDHIHPLIKKHAINFKIDSIGTSVLGETIHAIKLGSGSKKILMWSQMHGNESTTTKAIFDLCNLFSKETDENITTILEKCTIAIIPMLNPDGSKLWTRHNANGIDLNRDAQDLSQSESKALRYYFDSFKPDFCFNLHGQRTIFSVGKQSYPATVSFLAPAQDDACTVADTRKIAMDIVVKMNENLQSQIPKQVGIYDDAFNINCVGDTFQTLNVPTVLFEAGHYHDDYDREVVREWIFQSLLVALDYIAVTPILGKDYSPYFDIPQNEKCFYDIVIRNAKVKGLNTDIGIQYQERLLDGIINFVPVIDKISNLNSFFGHKELDANNRQVLTAINDEVYEGYENDFVLINNEQFSLNV